MNLTIPCTITSLVAPGPKEATIILKPVDPDEPAAFTPHTADPKVLAELRLGLKLVVNVRTAGAA